MLLAIGIVLAVLAPFVAAAAFKKVCDWAYDTFLAKDDPWSRMRK